MRLDTMTSSWEMSERMPSSKTTRRAFSSHKTHPRLDQAL